MHSIIKLHVAYGNHLPIYIFVDKIVNFIGNDNGSHVVLVSNNDYDKMPLSVMESPKEILELIADTEAVEADEDRALLSKVLSNNHPLSC